MKTMDCATLGKLIENHEPLDLIDIRPKNEFQAIHIRGARSVPFRELATPKGFRHWRPTLESVYIISDDRGKASLAAGILRASGYLNATVVEGGIKAWLAEGFPVLEKERSFQLSKSFKLMAGVLAIASGIAFDEAKSLLGLLILVSATGFFLKAVFVARTAVPYSGPTAAC